ncbi:hypothetical protein GGQ81_000733 [Sphingomonas desiccabilis]|nr:hypothetical protein [Sphingomonas desiccabilis]
MIQLIAAIAVLFGGVNPTPAVIPQPPRCTSRPR